MVNTITRGKLWFLVGNIKSGKSRWADLWVKHKVVPIKYCPTIPLTPRVIIAGDDFRTALHGKKFIPQAEGTVFAAMDIAARALLLRGFDVLIDETSSTTESIIRYLKIDINAKPVFINTLGRTVWNKLHVNVYSDAQICKKRATDLGLNYLLTPIDRITEQLYHITKDWPETFAAAKRYVESRNTGDSNV